MRYLSIMATASTIVVFAALALRRRAPHPLGVARFDAVHSVLLRVAVLRGAPLIIMVVWFSLALVTGVLIPLGSRESFFGDAYGLLTTGIYTLVVPFGMAWYAEMVIAADDLFSDESRRSLGAHWTARFERAWNSEPGRVAPVVIGQLTLLALALAAQWMAIANIEKLGSAQFPWVAAHDSGQSLNACGAAYYALRGLLSYFALASFVCAIMVWKRLCFSLRVDDPRSFVTNAGTVREEVVRLGTAIAGCLVAATVATTMQGAALVAWGKHVSFAERMEDFLSSTYLGWLCVAIVSLVLGLSMLRWLQRTAQAGVNRLVDERLATLQSLWEEGDRTLSTYTQYLDSREKVIQAGERVGTWPLPAGGKLAMLLTLCLQGVNLAAAVWAAIV